MEISDAVRALSALAQESRLEVFGTLARAEPSGLPASAIAERLAVPPSTLSFHLDQLVTANLLARRREGRSLIYSLRADKVRDLLWFLGEDCCQGNTQLCVDPVGRIQERTDEAAEPIPRPRVLFLCSRNSARSQMAEAILRRAAGNRFEVHSCGLRPDAIHPFTLRVLAEGGYDTTTLRSKDLSEYLGKVPIQHAIVVCETANDHCPRIHPFARNLHYWPFPDPVTVEGTEEERLEAFRRVRRTIEEWIERWLVEEMTECEPA